MAISTKVLAAERILAIDLGKYKSVECRYDASSGEVALASFDTTRSELVQRLTRHRPDVAVIVACALSGWVHDVCSELRIPCRVSPLPALRERGRG